MTNFFFRLSYFTSTFTSSKMNTSADCSDNFVLCVQMFRIIILTFNRPQSLKRLLTSIDSTDYAYGKNSWNLHLEIHIDGGGDLNADVVDIANQFEFKHGRKAVKK